MGWYSSGPGGALYKYGDVIEAECQTEAGVSSIVPKIQVGDAEMMWLEDCQNLALERGLPWSSLPFETFYNHRGLALEYSGAEHLDELEDYVRRHEESIRALADATTFEPVVLALDVIWHVPASQLKLLFGWFEKWGPLEQPLPQDLLADGSIDVGYRPPSALCELFDALRVDSTAHFLANMLGAHAVAGGAFVLEQPCDDYQRVVRF